MMPASPSVSVIIPAYNARATLGACLDSLARQTVPPESYEVIVVDDGSTDGSPEIARSRPGVRLLAQPHAGPGAARNLGAREARAPLLLFTDADCVPEADWIARMMAPFCEPELAGAKGSYGGGPRGLVPSFVQMEYEDKYRRMARERYIDFVDTYSAGYRRDVFLAAGGFDTAFSGASVEDQELSFRLARGGHKMVFVPEARVHHLGHAATLPAYWRKKFNIGYWKVLVHARHPDKLLRDSHTPQVLKVQVLLAGIGALCLGGGILWRPLRRGALLSGLLFLASALPFVARSWRKDPLVAALAPALLLVRALALGSGFAAGLGSRIFQREGQG